MSLTCGGNPDSSGDTAFSLSSQRTKGAVAATLCRRTPQRLTFDDQGNPFELPFYHQRICSESRSEPSLTVGLAPRAQPGKLLLRHIAESDRFLFTARQFDDDLAQLFVHANNRGVARRSVGLHLHFVAGLELGRVRRAGRRRR